MVCNYTSSNANMISCGRVLWNYSYLKEKLENVCWHVDHNDMRTVEPGLKIVCDGGVKFSLPSYVIFWCNGTSILYFLCEFATYDIA
jgi:hypothetical protein